MNFVALRMLTGDRAKYIGLVFAIAFSTFILEIRATGGALQVASNRQSSTFR
jgi:hypothetical protein